MRLNPAVEALKEICLGVEPAGRLGLLGRAGLLAVLAVWGARLMTAPLAEGAQSVLHYVNLPFHEAGHVIFAPLGRFMQVLGGTLMQLLIPLAAMLTLLWRQRDAFGASVAGWWLGQNLLDIAPYVGDARAGRLPLLGGVTGSQVPGFHDWQNILGRLGWLEHDQMLARASFGAGALLMLAALAWGGCVLYLQYQTSAREGWPE
jgi:hypothetical protein